MVCNGPIWSWEGKITWRDSLKRDELLFCASSESPAFLVRAYEFLNRSLSVGRLYDKNVDSICPCGAIKVPVWRRISGGAFALHGGDLCFSVHIDTVLLSSLPSTLQEMFSESLVACLEEVGAFRVEKRKGRDGNGNIFCFQTGNDCDIFYNECKFAGWGGRIGKKRAFFQFQCGAIPWEEGLVEEELGVSLRLPRGYRELLDVVKEKRFLDCLFERFLRRLEEAWSGRQISSCGVGR